MIYRNNKLGSIYITIGNIAIDCTAGEKGKQMIVYRHICNDDKVYVRDMDEFLIKFTLISKEEVNSLLLENTNQTDRRV